MNNLIKVKEIYFAYSFKSFQQNLKVIERSIIFKTREASNYVLPFQVAILSYSYYISPLFFLSYYKR